MSEATDIGVGLAGGAVLVGATQAAGLSPWEAHAREDAAERRKRAPKRRPSAVRARKAKTKRAVKRATRHTRASLMRDLTRKAA